MLLINTTPIVQKEKPILRRVTSRRAFVLGSTHMYGDDDLFWLFSARLVSKIIIFLLEIGILMISNTRFDYAVSFARAQNY